MTTAWSDFIGQITIRISGISTTDDGLKSYRIVISSKQSGIDSEITRTSNDMKIFHDGTILLRKDAGTKCPPLGQRTLALSVRDGRVGHINIKNPGTNCPASGDLAISPRDTFGSGVARIIRTQCKLLAWALRGLITT